MSALPEGIHLGHNQGPPLDPERKATDQHRFRDGSAEIERLNLSAAAVRAIMMAEILEREEAAAEMIRLASPDRADALRADAMLARRYID